jgi:putative DNA primase/helicase
MENKLQIKKESASPTDPESVADELKLKFDIRHHEGSFYIFDEDGNTWNQSSIDDIKSMILFELPGGYNQTKVNAIIEVLRLKSRINPLLADKKTIIFKNGILNVDDGSFRAFNKFDFVINPLQADYIPEAVCPRFIQFLDEIFINDPDKESKILMLQQFVGYSLTKDTSFQKSMLFVGNGSNGKSVILNLYEALFGNVNISKLELGQLGNPFHVPSLQNKYINVCNEINSKEKFSEALFKQIVSGETIFADRKFQEPFQFKPFVRLIFATNSLPYSQTS